MTRAATTVTADLGSEKPVFVGSSRTDYELEASLARSLWKAPIVQDAGTNMVTRAYVPLGVSPRSCLRSPTNITATAQISLQPVIWSQARPVLIYESPLHVAQALARPLFPAPLVLPPASEFVFMLPSRGRRGCQTEMETLTTNAPAISDTMNPIERLTLPSDYLARRMFLAFSNALDERFEDGMESEFSRTLISLIQTYGNAAVSALEAVLSEEQINAEVAEEALRWLGAVDHQESYKYRLWILQNGLRSPSARIRDAAGLGLAAMDDPGAIPTLQEAIAREQYEEVRQGFQLVLDQLEHTLRCRPS